MFYSFVVLHYKIESIVDTIECIKSILKNVIVPQKSGISITVVDNGSNDLSFEKLTSEFSLFSNVDVIRANKNLGFARGNNYGCMYCIQKYDPNFLIVINNDTIISQKKFIIQICNEYRNNKFDILGPKIIGKNGLHQNPIRFDIVRNLEDIEKMSIILKDSYELSSKSNCLIRFIKRVYKFFCKWYLFKPIEYILFIMRLSKYSNQKQTPLHGSALIFSKDYIRRYASNIFYPNTFLYLEEDILFYIARRDSLKTYVSKNITINHKEDVSTNSVVSVENKVSFFTKNKLESLSEFKKLIIKDRKKEIL